MSFRHSTDFFLIKDTQLFTYGWGFSDEHETLSVTLVLHFTAGEISEEIGVEFGKDRGDVKQVFGTDNSLNSGYLAIAGFGNRALARVDLCWQFSNGSGHVISVFSESESRKSIQLSPKVATPNFGFMWRKVIATLRELGIKATFRKILLYSKGRPKASHEELKFALSDSLNKPKVAMVIDHDMGGGANIYRKAQVEELKQKGQFVIFLGFHVASLSYFIEIEVGGKAQRFVLDQLSSLFTLIANLNLVAIYYNCAVSFRRPLDVVKLMIDLKRIKGAELIVSIHDYFIVCPSQFLLDDSGEFCGVPELSKCKECLPNHKDGWVSLAGTRDIVFWRAQWEQLIKIADTVKVFSNSSVRLLTRAFGTETTKSFVVLPHALPEKPLVANLSAGDQLRIGVVGSIGRHKGAAVVAELANEILKSNLPIKIVVVGTIDVKVPSAVVQVLGSYRPRDLPNLLRESGVNIVLFPSLLAETFSYVANELIAMKVPFVCFDVGAQADLAREYDNGLVLASHEPAFVLEEMDGFWRRLYQTNHRFAPPLH